MDFVRFSEQADGVINEVDADAKDGRYGTLCRVVVPAPVRLLVVTCPNVESRRDRASQGKLLPPNFHLRKIGGQQRRRRVQKDCLAQSLGFAQDIQGRVGIPLEWLGGQDVFARADDPAYHLGTPRRAGEQTDCLHSRIGKYLVQRSVRANAEFRRSFGQFKRVEIAQSDEFQEFAAQLRR